MKHFEINWLDFLDRLPLWEQLPLGARRALAELECDREVPRARLDGHHQSLMEMGLVRFARGRTRIRVQESGRVLLQGIRAMLRHDVLKNPTPETLNCYMDDHYRAEELIALAPEEMYTGFLSPTAIAEHVVSITWLDRFLARQTERPRRHALPGYLPSWLSVPDQPSEIARPSAARGVAQKIVRQLMELPEPLPLIELGKQFPDVEPAALADGLLLGVRELVLFPAMCGAEMTPLIGLWPEITQWLQRPKAGRPRPVKARAHFQAPLLMEDMTTVLVAAAAAPLRLRVSDGGLFAKTLRDLSESVMPIPEWFLEFAEFSPEYRLESACRWLRMMGFARNVGGHGQDLGLEATRRGHAWLGESPKERLKLILDCLREGDACLRRLDGSETVRIPDYARGGLPRFEFLPVRIQDAGSASPALDLRRAVTEAFGSIEAGQFVPTGGFLQWRVDCSNPLLDRYFGPGRPMLRVDDSYRIANRENLEEFWERCLTSFLVERLIPLGGAEVGAATERNLWCFALTDIGRYLLGLAGDFEYGHAAAGEKQVVVQPNFEVVFLGPAPLAEAAIGRFAERKKQGVGALYAITKKSIIAAAAGGMTADQVLETLRDVSDKPVPANVEREITGWFDQCRRVHIRTATLIECPDAETAARVVAAAGREATPLNETVVELNDGGGKTALVRKLREMGVFLDESGPAAPRARARTRARGRRLRR